MNMLSQEVLFFAPQFAGKTGGEVYNSHLVSALQPNFRVERTETLAVRASVAEKLGTVSQKLYSKQRIVQRLTKIRLLGLHGLFKRNIITDWESIHDVSWLLAMNRIRGGKNIVLVFHFDEWFTHPDRVSLQARAALRSATSIVTISEFSRQQLQKLSLSCDIRMIRPGSKKRLSPPKTGSALGGVEPVRILFVGNLIERKNLHTLVDAIAQLKHCNFILLLVGSINDSKYVNDLKLAVETQGIEHLVHFKGRLDEEQLDAHYDNSDIFVFPSSMEGYGIAVADALEAGLPIVAANSGAVPELVEDGKNGFLFHPRDPMALAAALKKLIEEPSLRRRMGQRSLEMAKGLSSWEQFEVTAHEYILEKFSSPSKHLSQVILV